MLQRLMGQTSTGGSATERHLRAEIARLRAENAELRAKVEELTARCERQERRLAEQQARIVDLAEEAHRGRVVGLYYLLPGLAAIPAPLLGGLLWQYGYGWPFVVGGLASGLGLGVYAVRPRVSEQPAPPSG